MNLNACLTLAGQKFLLDCEANVVNMKLHSVVNSLVGFSLGFFETLSVGYLIRYSFISGAVLWWFMGWFDMRFKKQAHIVGISCGSLRFLFLSPPVWMEPKTNRKNMKQDFFYWIDYSLYQCKLILGSWYTWFITYVQLIEPCLRIDVNMFIYRSVLT